MKIRLLIIAIISLALLLSSCSSPPSENTIQTAIAETQLAQPTLAPSSTFTPDPTNTPPPTSTITPEPSPTVTAIQKFICKPDFHLVDIVQSGLGVIIEVKCSETNPEELFDISILLPAGTTKTMEDDVKQYMHQALGPYDWNLNDLDNIFQQLIDDCNVKVIILGEITGLCVMSETQTKVIAFAVIK